MLIIYSISSNGWREKLQRKPPPVLFPAQVTFVSESFRLLQGRASEDPWVSLGTDRKFFLKYLTRVGIFHYSVICKKQSKENRQERSEEV